jgi:hypothetical protein
MNNDYSPMSIRTLCHTCAGCNQQVLKGFSGVVKCDNYVFAYPEYYESLEKDYGSDVEKNKKK